ncbi:hypothetical protein OAV30_00360 [Candidatus Pelagibacter sp.]|nr:hypothetical protein [Candidatus Pelagibacter sp.]
MYQLRSHRGLGVNYTVIEKKVMATEKKDRPWDGKSRPSDDNYRQRWNEIFGKKEKTTSELLREGYEEEKKMLEDEEYLEEIKNKI